MRIAVKQVGLTCISAHNHDCEIEVPVSDDESEVSPDRPRRASHSTAKR